MELKPVPDQIESQKHNSTEDVVRASRHAAADLRAQQGHAKTAAPLAFVGATALIFGIAVAAYFAGIAIEFVPASVHMHCSIHAAASVAQPALPPNNDAFREQQRTGLIAAAAFAGIGLALLIVRGIMGLNTRDRSTHTRSLAIYSLVLSAACVAGFLGLANSTPGGISAAIGEIESTAATMRGLPANQGKLENSGMDVTVVSSSSAAAKWANPAAPGTRARMQSLVGSGGGLLVPSETHAKLLGSAGNASHVAIEGGPHDGQLGWIASNEFQAQ